MAYFIGVSVQPKTFRPIYHSAWENQCYAHESEPDGSLRLIGRGYFDDSSLVWEGRYARCRIATGYPRTHMAGLVDEDRDLKKGYGTPLYVGMALYATAIKRGLAEQPAGLSAPPLGEGVCSIPYKIPEDGDGGYRSEEADAWWDGAVGRGVAKREFNLQGIKVEETVDGSSLIKNARRKNKVEVARVLSQFGRDVVKARQKATDRIARLVGGKASVSEDTDQDVYNLRYSIAAKTPVEKSLRVVDSLDFSDVWSKGLIALFDPILLDVPYRRIIYDAAAVTEWAALPPSGQSAKEIVLGLNLSHESPERLAKWVSIAEALGASKRQIQMMRNLATHDATIGGQRGGIALPQRKRPARVRQLAEPTEVVAETLPDSVERDLAEREAIRASLPWGDLAELD